MSEILPDMKWMAMFAVSVAGEICGLPPVCTEGRCAGLARMDVVIPTYHVDLCRVEIQLRSIERFNVCGVLGDIHLFWVDGREPAPRAPNNTVIHEVQLHWYNWKGQQIAKLEAFKFVKTEWYLVLDSKNVFVGPITLSGLFAYQKWAQYPLGGGTHGGWDLAAAKVLGLSDTNCVIEPSITPHMMHRARVSALLEFLTMRGGIAQALHAGATEFTLYEVFGLVSKDGVFEPWRAVENVDQLMPENVPHKSVVSWTRVATDARAALEFEKRLMSIVRELELGNTTSKTLVLSWHHTGDQGRFRHLFQAAYQNAGVIVGDTQVENYHRCFNATCRCLEYGELQQKRQYA